METLNANQSNLPSTETDQFPGSWLSLSITQKIPTLMEYTSARRYDAFKQLPDHHYFDTSEPCHSCAVISSENARLRGLKLINSFHTWARRQIAFINKIHFCFHMGFAQKHFFLSDTMQCECCMIKETGILLFS